MSTITSRLDEVLNIFRGWQIFASRMKNRATEGSFGADQARQVVTQARATLESVAKIPRTQAVADKVAEEWGYTGNIGADFAAVENAIEAVGDWVAARDQAMWTGYAIANTYPWAETVPNFTPAQTAELQTLLDSSVSAIAVFLGNIAQQ